MKIAKHRTILGIQTQVRFFKKACNSQFICIALPHSILSRYLINYNTLTLQPLFQILDNVDYTDIKILDLYPKYVDIRTWGFDATVCGWGTATEDDQKHDDIGNSNYSDDLHCMSLNLYSLRHCKSSARHGNFTHKMMLGYPEHSKQTTTLVITSKKLHIDKLLYKLIYKKRIISTK